MAGRVKAVEKGHRDQSGENVHVFLVSGTGQEKLNLYNTGRRGGTRALLLLRHGDQHSGDVGILEAGRGHSFIEFDFLQPANELIRPFATTSMRLAALRALTGTRPYEVPSTEKRDVVLSKVGQLRSPVRLWAEEDTLDWKPSDLLVGKEE